jgi:hypothetical protein
MFRVSRLVVGALAGLVTASLLVTINLLAGKPAHNYAPDKMEKVKVHAETASIARMDPIAQITAHRAPVLG